MNEGVRVKLATSYKLTTVAATQALASLNSEWSKAVKQATSA